MYIAAFKIFLIGVVIGVVGSTFMPPDPNPECPSGYSCYKSYGAPVQAEHILSGAVVRVVFQDASELPPDTEARIVYWVDYDSNMAWCVIYAQMPQYILGDPLMDALGHELLHCIAGEFHP